MKWNEKSNLQKTVLVISFLLVAVDITLFILDVRGVWDYDRLAERFMAAVFFCGFGFAHFLENKRLWYSLSVCEFLGFVLMSLIRLIWR